MNRLLRVRRAAGRIALILRKDLLALRRSPVLAGVLVAYPLMIAVLVGLVAGYGSAKPRVALVDRDGLPHTVQIAGESFDVDRIINEASEEVTLVRLSQEEAERKLGTGEIVASVTVPPGFVAELRGMVRSPVLELKTTRGALAPRVTQQVQALVYALNRELQDAFIRANLAYVELLLNGGNGTFLGRDFDVLGLEGAERTLARMPDSPEVNEIREFIGTAELALAETDDAIRATAHPIELVEAQERGRAGVLSAQVQAYALALTLTFLALVLAAGAIAAERDENTLARLVRGFVRLGEIVWAKVALAAVVALGVGLAIALAFGLFIELRGVVGGQPWSRFPLLALGLVLAGASLGALGVLLGTVAREARTASLVAVCIVVPVILLGLVPRELVPPAGWISDGLPFAHAVRLFGSALYDVSPWRTLAVEAAWLAALGGIFGVLARAGMRRLVA